MNIIIYINERKLERNATLATNEYIKRLGAYCKPSIILKRSSDNSIDSIFNSIKQSEHTLSFLVSSSSKTLASEELAEQIKDFGLQGVSTLIFFIGYDNPKQIAGIQALHLSSMELSNALCQVVLCEQLYRSYRILNNQPYHK